MADDDKLNIDKAASVGNYLNLYFSQNQGVRLGESTVVSLKAHAKMPEKKLKGQIKILLNQDAGKTYLDFVENNKVIHIDVYHRSGKIDPRDIARAVFGRIDSYILEKEPQLQYAEEERFRLVTEFANKVFLATNQGKGTVYDLFQGIAKPLIEGEEGSDHVHLLARLNREEYYIVYIIVEAVEETILAAGLKLSKVRNISHGNQKVKEDDFAGYIKLPWKRFKGQPSSFLPAKENINQLIVKLAEKFGGINEIEEFMESYSTNILKRKGIEQQKKKWGEVEHFLEQLEDLELIKSTIIGKVFTRKGIELKEYVLKHKCELETEIRRNMRKIPSGGSSRFRKLGKIEKKSAVVEFTNRNKTANCPDRNWSGDLAVPDTIIKAKKNCFLRGDSRFAIRKEDLHYYEKKSYIPINVCLLMDASGSMAGDKRQAACYLAQNLLLTGREKVAVVTFQERNAQIVVPFTRNHSILSKGLSTISPAGLTPMAHGIVAAVDLIASNRVKNPLLVMITDGIPNSPLWTLDAQADALNAAKLIAENKLRFICIGVESNRLFLEKVCDQAQGILYLVDDLNKDNLINIVRMEKRDILNRRRRVAN
ncbi:MAG: vWA domain-containing protein [Syntrophomonadaceae bacterium]|jgi:magnesium chelatase subunit D